MPPQGTTPTRTWTPSHRRCGCVSSGGSIGLIRSGEGCDLLIRCTTNSPRSVRVIWTGSGLPRTLARSTMAATVSIRVIRVTLSGSGLPPASGPGRHRQRPGASESQDSVGTAVARGAAAGRCAGCRHRNRRDAEAVRPGPAPLAGQSITELPSLSPRAGPLPVCHPVRCLRVATASARGDLGPGPARGAGLLIRRSDASEARPLRGPVWHRALLAVHWPHPLALRPAGRRAACAGQRPARVSRGGLARGELAPHKPSVAPAGSTRCWLTGCKSRQPQVPGAGSRANNCDLYPALLSG